MVDVLEFGNRGGSWFALLFFSALFGGLGWMIAREVRVRTNGEHLSLGRLLGALVFVGPVLLVYWSMLSGFYEVEFIGRSLRLHYLLPGVAVDAPLDHSSSRIIPAYRDRVRFVLSTDYGVFESPPSPRGRAVRSLERFRERLQGPLRETPPAR
jgi:hypothetical protein